MNVDFVNVAYKREIALLSAKRKKQKSRSIRAALERGVDRIRTDKLRICNPLP